MQIRGVDRRCNGGGEAGVRGDQGRALPWRKLYELADICERLCRREHGVEQRKQLRREGSHGRLVQRVHRTSGMRWMLPGLRLRSRRQHGRSAHWQCRNGPLHPGRVESHHKNRLRRQARWQHWSQWVQDRLGLPVRTHAITRARARASSPRTTHAHPVFGVPADTKWLATGGSAVRAQWATSCASRRTC